MPLNLRENQIQDKAVVDVLRDIDVALAGLGDSVSSSVTFATSGTAAVTFDSPVQAANYRIFITGNVNETFWVTSKTVTGFTLNSSNASSVAVVDWLLIE